ncbi:MAG: translation elongation factor Ts [Chloroherpetonaceae bacterium]|nr:translation elongation factor Ts [Chthonomonadaceae bacterium]MDW8208954.1 translation elongation factor Ts [Chloroherpetonaceae bacterium]
MAEITAKMVMELRERTGAGMMDCKAALQETGGNFEEAIIFLRKKMGKKAEDRGERASGEGVIAVYTQVNPDGGQSGAIIELNSETDFVARSEDFKTLARELAEQVARTRTSDVAAVLAQESLVQPGVRVQDRVTDIFSKLRESIVFRRCAFIATGPNGALAAYVHVPANDKIGVLVELEASSPEQARSEAVQTLGRELAMQVAASRPRYMTREEVPESVIQTEMEIARAQNEGKPETAMARILEGRLRKFYEETVLLDQKYLRDPVKTVSQLIAEAGEGVSLKRYIRYEVGEGVTGVATSGAIKEQAE